MVITLNQKLQFLELLQQAETLGIKGIFSSNAKSDLEELAIKLWEDGFLPVPTVDVLLETLEDTINEEREKQNERQTLRVLELLSSTTESLACDYTGEAKTELRTLCHKMRVEVSYAIEDKDSVVEQLEKALKHLENQEKQWGANILYQVSRDLWNRVDLSPSDAR